MVLRFVILLLHCLCRACEGSNSSASSIRLGIPQDASTTDVDAVRYEDVMERIRQGTNRTIEAVSYGNMSVLCAKLNDNALDYVLMSPVAYIRLQDLVQPVASVVLEKDGVESEKLSGAIIVHSSSGIQSVAEIKGRSVAIVNPSDMSGCLAQGLELKQAGVELYVDSSVVYIADTHQNVIASVQAGFVDVGFVKAGVLESLAHMGAVELSDMRFLNPSKDPLYPYTVSTSAYAGLLFAASNNVTTRERTLLTTFLLRSTVEDIVPASSKLYFVPTDNYVGVSALLEELMDSTSAVDDQCDDSTEDAFVFCPQNYRKIKPANDCDDLEVCKSLKKCICDVCTAQTSDKVKVKVLASLGVIASGAVIVSLVFWVVWLTRCRATRNKNGMSCIMLTDIKLNEPSVIVGESTLGLVLLGKYWNAQVALKRIVLKTTTYPSAFDKDKLNPEEHNSLKYTSAGREAKAVVLTINKLTQLHHDNVLPVIGVAVDLLKKEYISVTPYVKYGTLYDLLENRSVEITQDLARSILRDVATGLKYLHSLEPPIHGRNLRTEHLFVGARLKIKIGTSMLEGKRTLWTAPEFDGEPNAETDLYAFGLLVYEVVYRRSPYDGEGRETRQVFDRWKLPTYDPSKEVDDLHKVIERCLSWEPRDRPSIEHVLQLIGTGDLSVLVDSVSPESKKSKELLRQMLPASTADAVLNGTRVEELNHEKISICCAKLAGLLDVSRTLSPEEFVEVRRDIRNCVESITYQHGLFTIASVDETFICVANMGNNQNDYASRICRFAKELRSCNLSSRPSLKKIRLRLRVGIHTGSLKSRLLNGSHNLRYCLLGPTLSIAVRLQLYSQPGQSTISEATYDSLRLSDPLRGQLVKSQGGLYIRGKGHYLTYAFRETQSFS